MTTPIRLTPTIYGKDANRIIKETENVKYSCKKEKFLKECDEVYNKIKHDEF